MGLIMKLESRHGLDQPLYWRFNNFEQLANREPDGSRISAMARFHGYLSQEAFHDGKHFLEELIVEFTPSSSSADLAAEAYAALRAIDPTTLTVGELEDAHGALSAAKIELDAAVEGAKDEKPRRKDAAIQAPGAALLDTARMQLAAAERRVTAATDAHKAAKQERMAIEQAKDA